MDLVLKPERHPEFQGHLQTVKLLWTVLALVVGTMNENAAMNHDINGIFRVAFRENSWKIFV